MKFTDSHLRSLLKALTWRVVASCDTLVLVWLVTGSFTIGASVSVIEVFTKILVFFLHERAWENVKVKHIKKTKKIVEKTVDKLKLH